MPRPTPFERARAYLQKSAPRAIQGSGGDNTTYAFACALVIEFALSDDEAWGLLTTYNATKCTPPWSEKDLAAKLRSARMMARSKPSEVGRLLDADRRGYAGASSGGGSSANSAPRAAVSAPHVAAALRPTGPPTKPPPASRTERTPLFTVHQAGVGAEPRTRRTLRTLVCYSSTQTATNTTICIVNKEPSEVYQKPKAIAPEKCIEAPVEPTPEAMSAPGLGFAKVYDSIADFATTRAKESGNMVTIFMKNSGRTVRVNPDGTRKLMDQADPEP